MLSELHHELVTLQSWRSSRDDFSLDLVSLNSKSGMLRDRNVALMINLSISLYSLNELFELLRLNTKVRL